MASAAHAQLAGGSGPITGYHDNPSECTSCHFSNPAAFTATANITGPVSVLHGQLSSTFSLSGTGGTRRGFNIAIYRVSGNVKQTTAFSNLSAGINTPTSNELQHTVAESRTSWSFRWTAPATLGSYRVYACVNPVNNDGNDGALDGNAACDTYNFSVTNQNPNALNDFNIITVAEDSGLSGTFNVLTNDVQTQGDAFSWDSTNTAGLSGSLQDNSNGTYRFNPNGQFESLDSGEFGSTTFTYTIEENAYAGYTDTATVTLRVSGANDAPMAAQDGAVGAGNGHVTVNEGAVANNVGNLLANDSDVDVESLTSSRAGPGCAAVSPGEASAFTLNTDGTFNYTHDGSEPLQDSFSYCAYDGTAYSAARTVYIDIAPVNDPPTISGFAGSVGFTEQTPVVIDNSISFSDVDSSQINRARLTISANYAAGDTLACGALPAGIACSSFDVPSRSLTLSGVASYADYYSAIGAVSFNSTSDNPSLSARTVDLDVRDEDLGTSLDAQKTVTITRSNDPPTLAPIANQVALENTGADPYTFTYTAVASDVDVDDDINNGAGSLSYSLSGAPVGMTVSNASPTHGRISWNPPQTGVFGQVYGPISVLIEDGDEDVSAPSSVNFNVTVSPPDGDGDLVANYNDLCLTVADATNADNDGDGTPGSDGGANDGGDVCDLDDDNDDMPDSYEIANFFDPFDPADGAPTADADGDGIPNDIEFLNGSNSRFADELIDSTGYLTPHELQPPSPSAVHPMATTAVASDYGPYRPGRHIITWTGANSINPSLGTSDQTLDIQPLVNFAADQLAEEGSAVTVNITLNGDAVSWPTTAVTVDYSVSGSAANPADHDALPSVVTFNDQVYQQSIVFNVAADGLTDPDESVVFTIDRVNNAAIGSSNSHRVTIVEANVAPQASLEFDQGGPLLAAVYDGDNGGNVNIAVNATDLNAGQSLSYDWSGSDNSLVPPGNTATWNLVGVSAGNYLIDVAVTDDGTPARSTRVSRILNVLAGASAALGAADSDNDGRNDNDPLEGYGDDDDDGIPNYLDANSNGGSESNLIPDQTVDMSNSVLLQTDPGLRITRGKTAQAANNFGTLLTDSEIAQFGSASGTAPLNAADSSQHIAGIYDFEVSGLVPRASARVVIPLLSGIPRNAVYRKFNPATGWSDFVIDANNGIASAVGALGACPEPGSSAYRSGLNYLDSCIELRIQDGGPNDTDNSVNGIVTDPGTIGVQLSDPQAFEVEEGGGRMSPTMLAVLLLLSFMAIRRRGNGGMTD